AWAGGFLNLHGVAFDGAHGPSPEVGAAPWFSTGRGPGWGRPGTEDVSDPRDAPYGPVPKDWMNYKGLYRHADGTVFSYTVGDTEILEMPSVRRMGDDLVFVRTFQVSPTRSRLFLRVCDLEAPVRATGTYSSFEVSFDAGNEMLGVGVQSRVDRRAWNWAAPGAA